MPWAQKFTENVFSHPDYTVGSGFSPDQPLSRVMDFVISDFTIGRDFHPATKTYVSYLVFKPMMVHLLLAISITTFLSFVKFFFTYNSYFSFCPYFMINPMSKYLYEGWSWLTQFLLPWHQTQ